MAAAEQQLRQLCRRPDSDEMVQISQDWTPYRSVAARLLYHYYLFRKEKS
ncbi:MAG: hypothetical protein HKN69_12340 [Desulfofustis sp.]|nr:hypothetical protein [Desulfofustis sp.]